MLTMLHPAVGHDGIDAENKERSILGVVGPWHMPHDTARHFLNEEIHDLCLDQVGPRISISRKLLHRQSSSEELAPA